MEKLTLNDFLKLDKKDLQNKIICFPTDTVYGVGALFNDKVAIRKIYEMKKRDFSKPLANLCAGLYQIQELGITVPEFAKELMEKYWPGPLTIIIKHNEEKISFRMPNSEIALKILEKFGPMATTSVNESGEKELNSFAEINEQFGAYIDYFILDQAQLSKIPSTVIDVSEGRIKVLREGAIKFFEN